MMALDPKSAGSVDGSSEAPFGQLVRVGCAAWLGGGLYD